MRNTVAHVRPAPTCGAARRGQAPWRDEFIVQRSAVQCRPQRIVAGRNAFARNPGSLLPRDEGTGVRNTRAPSRKVLPEFKCEFKKQGSRRLAGTERAARLSSEYTCDQCGSRLPVHTSTCFNKCFDTTRHICLQRRSPLEVLCTFARTRSCPMARVSASGINCMSCLRSF